LFAVGQDASDFVATRLWPGSLIAKAASAVRLSVSIGVFPFVFFNSFCAVFPY
jgi:hypothetical protein